MRQNDATTSAIYSLDRRNNPLLRHVGAFLRNRSPYRSTRHSGIEPAAHSGVKLAPRACRRPAGIAGNGAALVVENMNAGMQARRRKHEQAKRRTSGQAILSYLVTEVKKCREGEKTRKRSRGMSCLIYGAITPIARSNGAA